MTHRNWSPLDHSWIHLPAFLRPASANFFFPRWPKRWCQMSSLASCTTKWALWEPGQQFKWYKSPTLVAMTISSFFSSKIWQLASPNLIFFPAPDFFQKLSKLPESLGTYGMSWSLHFLVLPLNNFVSSMTIPQPIAFRLCPSPSVLQVAFPRYVVHQTVSCLTRGKLLQSPQSNSHCDQH